MTEGLWRSDIVEKITEGKPVGPPWMATGISFDSRTVCPGDLFFALTGGERDGHEFIESAFANGAVAAIVERLPYDIAELPSFLIVDNIHEALQKLALESRRRVGAKILAVTGSVGKTGTKDALSLVLSKRNKVHATSGNFNNHIGVPISLARMPESTEFGVFELGMNRRGEIKQLAQLVKPQLAIITNINAVHLGHFEDEQGIADAKAEIFLGMSPDSQIVLNLDNKWGEFLIAKARRANIENIITFGRNNVCDVRLSKIETTHKGSVVELEISGNKIQYTLDFVGPHIAYNTVGVIACIHALNLDVEEAAISLKSIRLPRGRGGQVEIPLKSGASLTLIDESYNASPIAMHAALAVLGSKVPKYGGRRVAILGDMLELGADGPSLHANLLDHLLAAKPDWVITIGSLMRELYDKIPPTINCLHADRSCDVSQKVLDELRAGDLILIKGSLGTNMAPIVSAIENMKSNSRSPYQSFEVRGSQNAV